MKEDIKEIENIEDSKDFILESIREQARQVAENLLAIYYRDIQGDENE